LEAACQSVVNNASHEGRFASTADLMAALIHQMSQPLTVLMGESAMALQKQLNAAEYRAVIEKLLSESMRLSDCLSLYREIAAPPTPKERLNTSLADVVESVLLSMAKTAEEHRSFLSSPVGEHFAVAAEPQRIAVSVSRVITRLLRENPAGSIIETTFSTRPPYGVVTLAIDATAPESPSVRKQPALMLHQADWVVARWAVESCGGDLEAVREDSLTQVRVAFPLARV
jgi:hypothetical protein